MAGFLILKSYRYQNLTHSLNVAVSAKDSTIGSQRFNLHRKRNNSPPHLRGVWVDQGYEAQDNQFQLFRVPFHELENTISELVLPHIYRSYVRLQEYCPSILNKVRVEEWRRRIPVHRRQIKVYLI